MTLVVGSYRRRQVVSKIDHSVPPLACLFFFFTNWLTGHSLAQFSIVRHPSSYKALHEDFIIKTVGKKSVPVCGSLIVWACLDGVLSSIVPLPARLSMVIPAADKSTGCHSVTAESLAPLAHRLCVLQIFVPPGMSRFTLTE